MSEEPARRGTSSAPCRVSEARPSVATSALPQLKGTLANERRQLNELVKVSSSTPTVIVLLWSLT